MQRLTFLRKVRETVRTCPACQRIDWLPGDFDPLALLESPNSPEYHPELEYGRDGIAVLPATCLHCGFVALFSTQHFVKHEDPWA